MSEWGDAVEVSVLRRRREALTLSNAAVRTKKKKKNQKREMTCGFGKRSVTGDLN